MFGQLLRDARLKAKMTQEELASKAKLTREYVSLLEHNKRVPTITVFIRLARAVGINPADLLLSVEKSLRD